MGSNVGLHRIEFVGHLSDCQFKMEDSEHVVEINSSTPRAFVWHTPGVALSPQQHHL
jgi:hypothetical protein